MKNLFWRFVAFVVTRRVVFEWLKRRGWRTPYTHLGPPTDYYMIRLWLFNPYGKDEDGKVLPPRWPRLPSIRLHWIKRPDQDRHMHDHPWKVARTIVLDGSYEEERYGHPNQRLRRWRIDAEGRSRVTYERERGYTGELLLGDYHRISSVSDNGVWTFFITWGDSHGWGFLVNGKKIPWREYLKANDI